MDSHHIVVWKFLLESTAGVEDTPNTAVWWMYSICWDVCSRLSCLAVPG